MNPALAFGKSSRPAMRDRDLVVRLFGYAKAHRRLLWLSLMLYPLNALCVVLPPYIVQQVLDKAIAQRNTTLLTSLIAGYIVALICEYLTGFASEFSMSALGQRSMQKLRTDVFAHVQRLASGFFDKHPIGRILTRLTNDVEALSEVFSAGAITVFSDVLTVVAVVSTMLWLDVHFTLFALGVLPPLVGVAIFFQRFARQAFRNIRTHLARINAFLIEHIRGMEVVQIFRQEARTQSEFERLNQGYRDANRQAIFFDAALFAWVEAIGSGAVAVLIWYGAADLSHGTVTAGVLVAFIQYIRRFFVPIRDLSTKYTILQSALAAAERIFSLLDEPLKIQTLSAPRRIPTFQNSLELQDVWFSYKDQPTERDWVLRGLDLQLRRGEHIALVGSTGSGKSTVLKLLNRFYDVQKGCVRMDGVDIRQLDLGDLRSLFAVVLQDVHLFSGTLLDNLTLADRIQPSAAYRAMEAVQADALVARLPDGYHTHVQELGSNFSAGERQLLALARALALDPQVLILDEATSNVDSVTEAHLQKALDILLKDRTAVVVAHRLSTVQKVDRIVVLKQGRIVEEGSHANLMRQDGMYRALVDMQFQDPNAGFKT